MKKTPKKLVLAKETLGSLELKHVAGGETDWTCVYSNNHTCGCPTGDCTQYCPSNRVVCKQ